MEVKLVKLTCGDDVIGEIIPGMEVVTIKKPVTLHPTPNGIAMIEYPMFGNNEDLLIDRSAIAYITNASAKVAQAYTEKQTGLTLPPAKILEV